MDQSLWDPSVREAVLRTVAADLAAGAGRAVIADELVRSYGISSDEAKQVISEASFVDRGPRQHTAVPNWIKMVALVAFFVLAAVLIFLIIGYIGLMKTLETYG